MLPVGSCGRDLLKAGSRKKRKQKRGEQHRSAWAWLQSL